jgi:phage baseplate assembly protein W
MADNTTNPASTSFLGTGWAFPPTFLPSAGQVAMTSDAADIEASLKILLGTTIGERFLNPKYGLDLHSLLFEPMNTTMLTDLKDRVTVAILIYEARIQLNDLEMDVTELDEGKVAINLDYQIRATNSRFNLVYPFYITDGSEVSPSL